MTPLFELTPAAAAALLTFVARRLGVADSEAVEDAYRYEAIARAVTAVEHGSTQPFYHWVVCTWATQYYQELEHLEQQARVAATVLASRPEPFADVRAGKVSNPIYQMFLDTLTPEERAEITNNGPFFAWHAGIRSEMQRTGLSFNECAAAQRATLTRSGD